MRTAMDGTFFTHDKLVHMGKVPDNKCAYCQQEDGIYHRYWECPSFADARQNISATDTWDLCNSHCSFAERGWVPDCPSRVPFMKSLLTIPDTTTDSQTPPVPPANTVQHLFTDGSAKWPKHPDCRLASWAVVGADLEHHTFPTLACGGVPGLHQSALRAECTAAIAALQIILATGLDTTIWVDNATVHERLQQALGFPKSQWNNKMKDHDLWTRMHHLAQSIRRAGIRVQIIKVRAHQDLDAYPEQVERWVIKGNKAADEAAEHAMSLLPPLVTHLHQQFTNQVREQERRCTVMHTLFHAVGTQAVQGKKQRQDKTEQKWQEATQEKPQIAEHLSASLVLDRPLEQAPSHHSIRQCQREVESWVQSLQFQGQCTLQWVSFYHLFVHYMLTTGKPGFHFDRKARLWETAEKEVVEKGFYFLERSNAFSLCLRCFALQAQLQYTTNSHLPAGSLFRCWARCLLLAVPSDFVERLDRTFIANGVRTIRRVRLDLVAFPYVKGQRSL